MKILLSCLNFAEKFERILKRTAGGLSRATRTEPKVNVVESWREKPNENTKVLWNLPKW